MRWKSVAGICSGCVVIALVFSMVNTALPAIQENLGLTVGAAQWMMSVFGLINCAVLVTCGRLADIYGRKRVFMIGLLSTGAAMIGGGFCREAYQLIVCMALAGLGNAIILPVSQALLVSEFPLEEKGRAIGIWASAIGSALAAGPILGGMITGTLGWQWVYWLNAPVIALSLFLVFSYSRESRNTVDSPDLDILGMGCLAVSLSAFVLLLTEYPTLPVWSKLILVSLAVIGTGCLYWWEKRCSAPILRGDLLGDKGFLLSSIANGCLVFFIWSAFFLLPLYLQKVRHLSPLISGLLLLGITVPVAILSPPIGKLYKEKTAWLWISVGFILMLLSIAVQFCFEERTPLLWIAASTLLFGIAYSCIWGPSTTSAVSTLSEQQAGHASGTFVTIQEIGGMMGLATTATVAKGYSSLAEGFLGSLWVLGAVAFLGSLCAFLLKGSRGRSLDPSFDYAEPFQ